MKKRVLSILLCVCMVMSLLPMSTFAAEPTKTIPSGAFSSGQDGSYETPYEISSTSQFAYLDSSYGTHYFILKNNLNFNGSTTGISELTSYLEGEGHTISNYAGTLVGNNMGGTLTNLIIDNPVKYVPTTIGKAKVNYFGDANQPTYQQEFGFICATNKGLISSVQIKNATIQLYNEVGGGSWGLDWYDSTIYNRMSFITAVNSTRGYIRNCSVIDCTVEVSTTMVQFGALASIVETGLINGCSVIGLKFIEKGNVLQFSNYFENKITKGVESYEAGIMIGFMRYGTVKNNLVDEISCLKKDGSPDNADNNLYLIGASIKEGDYIGTVDTVQYTAGKTDGMYDLQTNNIKKVSSLNISEFNSYKDIVSSNNGTYHNRNLERSTTRPYLPIGYEAYLGQGKTQVIYWNHTELVNTGDEITLPLYTENTQDHSASYNDTYYDTFVDTYKVKYTKDGTDYGVNPKKAGTKFTVLSKGITISFDGDKIPYIVVDTSAQMGNTFVPKFNLTTDLVKWYDSYETADIDRVYPNMQSELQQKVALTYKNASGNVVTNVSKEPYGIYWVSFDSSNIYPGQLKNSTAKAQLWHTGPLTSRQASIRNTSNSYTGNIVSAKIPVLEEAKVAKPELSYEIWYEGTGTTTYELTQTAPKEIGIYNVYVKNLTAYQGQSYETSWAATDSVLLDTMSIADVGIIVSIDNVLQTNDFSIRYIKDGLEQTVNMSDGSISTTDVPNGTSVDLYYKTAKILTENNFDTSKLYNYDLVSLAVYSALDSGLAFGEKSSVSELNSVSENDMILRYFVKRGAKLSEVLTGEPSVYTYSLDTNGSKSIEMTFKNWMDASDPNKTLELDSIIGTDVSAVVASYSNERWSNLTVGETYYLYTGNVGTNLGANHNFTQFIYGGTINSRHDKWSDGYLNKVTLRDTITREMFISKEAYPYTWLNYVGTTNGYKLMGSNDGVSLNSNMSYAQILRIPTAGSYALYNGSNSAVISPKMSGSGFYQTNQPWNDRTQLYTKLGLAAAVINENGEYCWDKNYVDLRSAKAEDSYYTDASGAVTKGMSFSTQYGARLVIELLNEHKVNTNARITNQNQIHVVTLNFGKYAVDPEVSSIKCVFTTSSTDNYTISARPSQAKESMIGFNTAQDGSGTTYILGDLIPSSVTTLYAFGWQSLTEEECLDMGLDSKYIGYYPLYSPADFQRASTLVQTSNPGANFLVMNDIDFENIISTPIGYEVPYTGTLDGNFHVLRNINISSYMYSGLIGRAGNNATVKCLGIESGYFTVTGSTDVYRYLGAIIGYTEKISGLRAYIDRCWVGKDVLMERNGRFGGLCGSGGHYNTSSSSTCHITDSYFLGSINKVDNFEGSRLFLYPSNEASTVNNSFGVGKENLRGPGGSLNNTYYNIVKNYLYDPKNNNATFEQFASGEIAWKLNFDGGDVNTTHRGIWTQDTDYPMLVRGSLKPTYRVSFSGDGVDTVYAYSNCNGNIVIPNSVANRVLTYNSKEFTANTVVNSDINVIVGANATLTDAPILADDGNISIIQGSSPKNASFTLLAEPTVNTVYYIYNAATAGKLMGTVSQSGNLLNVTLFSAPTADSTDYYIGAQEENKAESTRIKVTCMLKPEPIFNSDISNMTVSYGDEQIVWSNSLLIGNGNVSFQSSNTDVASVDTNGTLTIKNIGSSTITVSVAEGTNNRAKAFTYTVIVNPKNVTETLAELNQNIIENIGSFTEPTFNSVTGTLSYSWNSETNKSYVDAVNYLKTLAKNDTVILNYSYTANGNYSGIITGTINFTVIGLDFTGDGLTIKDTATYGEQWDDIIQLDSSEYSASLNSNTISGNYRIQLKTGTEDYADMIGTTIPTAGEYSYQLLFNSNDNQFTNVVVESGTLTVLQRVVDIIWSDTVLTYNGSILAPNASISNKVGDDTVTVTVIGGQINVGNEYIATADALEGADKDNYKLPDVKPTQSFSIVNATTQFLWENATQTVIYTGNEAVITAPTVSQINNEPYEGTITYMFKEQGSADDYSLGLPVNAGIWLIKAHMTASGNYAAADSTDMVLTISPATLTIESVKTQDRKYVKDDTSVTITEVTFNGGSVTEGIDYTVAGSMENASAGENKAVTVTVTMTNKNYALSSSTASTTVNISKVEAVTLTDKSVSHRYNLIGEQSISVDGTMPDDAGTLNYSKGTESGTTTIVSIWSVEADGTVKFTIAGGSIGNSITLPVIINSDNYIESTVNVVITLAGKDNQTAPADFTLKFTLNDDETTYTATIPLVNGAEYSFDSIDWSADNTKSDVKPNDTVTGYIRMKATEEKSASAATSDTKTAPSMVETPISIPNGGMFSGTQTVTLNCLTDGASIYYNINGTKPTINSTLYEHPFTIADTTTVTAIAVKTGMHDSEVLTVAFTKYIGGNLEVSQSGWIYGETPFEPNYIIPEGAGAVSTTYSGITASGVEYSSNTTKPTQAGEYTFTVHCKSKTVAYDGIAYFTISPKILTVTGVKATNRKYDGTNKVTLTGGIVNGVVGNDDVSCSFTEGMMENPDIGNNKVVKITKPALTGADASNYRLGNLPDITVNIEPVPSSGGDSPSSGGSKPTDSTTTDKPIVNPFEDIAENDWYYNSVVYVYNNGLFAGTSDTTFSPNASMTRQMIWMVLARMDGKMPVNMDEARTWAMENNISDGTNPANIITREQMASILYRYAQYKGYDITQGGMAIREFSDYDNISEYAHNALGWMVNTGLMQGSNNNLMPSSSATRAQVAAILQRFCQSIAK